ncbi:hypothetical protein [Novosphingobium sp. EMRT-2]|uniref:hypothetical protein n=1 Tax=Novosphingobium sp. EMRT-2 TaxID=2571749 RepID=UPI0010BDC9AA|nr:hypothetical protein [Novosphingobium sp. EMRT-2]QCI92302.1 hypothetical protein FA702_01110 [Novosphingobium sp. EMRT-2]
MNDERMRLLGEIRCIERQQVLGDAWRLLIDGELQDDVMHGLVQSIVLGELRKRLRAVEADLVALGVVVG